MLGSVSTGPQKLLPGTSLNHLQILKCVPYNTPGCLHSVPVYRSAMTLRFGSVDRSFLLQSSPQTESHICNRRSLSRPVLVPVTDCSPLGLESRGRSHRSAACSGPRRQHATPTPVSCLLLNSYYYYDFPYKAVETASGRLSHVPKTVSSGNETYNRNPHTALGIHEDSPGN